MIRKTRRSISSPRFLRRHLCQPHRERRRSWLHFDLHRPGCDEHGSISSGGGGDITVGPLAPTGSRTLASIVTELNASGTFAAEATASAWNGHLRIDADNPADTLQMKVGGAAFNTLFGFDTTIVSPIPATDIIVELHNTKLTDY